MIRSAFVAIALLTAAFDARAALYRFAQPGDVRIGGGAARPATLQTLCSPDRDGGALSLELVVPQANTRRDFDYDAFEGPDAVAGDEVPATLAWHEGSEEVEVHAAASGWYAPEPPDSFVFGISQPSRRGGTPARLLAAVAADGGRLVWTQAGFDKPARGLVASFEFDAAAARRLRDAVASCLPPRPAAKAPATSAH